VLSAFPVAVLAFAFAIMLPTFPTPMLALLMAPL